MTVDIHAHYIPRDGLKIAREIGKRYDLLIGNPAETSLAFAKCIFGGVMERFFRLKCRLASRYQNIKARRKKCVW